MDFYVRRKDKVYGPLTESRLMQLAVAKKLTGEDVVATSSKGPWEPVADALKRSRKKPVVQATGQSDEQGAAQHASTLAQALHKREEKLRKGEERLRQAEQALRHHEEDLKQREEQIQQREKQLQHQAEHLRTTTPPPRQVLGHTAACGGAGTAGILRVQRNTGAMGALTKIKVFVDGELLAQLSANAVSDVPISAGKHIVEVKGGGAFSGAKHEIQIDPNTIHVLSVGYGMLGGLQITAAGIVGVGIAQMASEAAGGIAVGDVIEAADVVQNLISFFSDE